ncbi:MAG: DMT family transporter [Beijerinckiaceae bacterium]
MTSNIRAGILLRLLSTLLFGLMAMAVRLASAEAPVGQIVFWRSAVALIPIVLYLWSRGQFPMALKTDNPSGHFTRSLLGCTAMFFSFVALSYLPLSLATALGFLSPLIVVPAAMLFLRERPGWIVSGASLAGFLGVGLILLPALEGPGADRNAIIGVAAGLICAGVTAAAMVQVKRLTATEKPGTIAFYFALFCAVAGLLTWPFGWASPSAAALTALVASGLLGGLAHIAMTEGYARAPASTLAPFEYSAIVWALLLDALVFAVLPGSLAFLGVVLIVGAAATVAFKDKLPIRRKAVAA